MNPRIFLSSLALTAMLAACGGGSDGGGTAELGSSSLPAAGVCADNCDTPSASSSFQLGISATEGGTISGADCSATDGSSCTADYKAGRLVTMIATPHFGYSFAGWGGNCSGAGTSRSASVTMNSQANCIGHFVQNPSSTFKLTVNASSGGSVTGGSTIRTINCTSNASSTCSASYSTGTRVSLTATPSSGYKFTGWGGDCSSAGTAATATVTMNANASCSANFAQSASSTYRLTVSTTGGGNVSNGATIACSSTGGSSCAADYSRGSSASLTATPNAGYKFTGWGGDCSSAGTAATATVTMNADASCSASFIQNSPSTYRLTVSAPSGGSVSDGGVIACSSAAGSACAADYAAGTRVNLTETPASGYTFSGWTGSCASAGTAATATVTMNGDAGCGANFIQNAPSTYQLTVSTTSGGKVSGGSGTIACSSTAGGSGCSASYNANTTVTLTATADTGYIFSKWGGNCSGTSPTYTLTMTANESCSATFSANAPSSYTLNVSVTGNGTVIDQTANKLSCSSIGSASCSASYSPGATVTLAATAASGYTFAGWGGACASAGTGAASVTMSAPQNCSASFAVQAAASQTQFRGVDIALMEANGYTGWTQAAGPAAGSVYPVFDTRLFDYYKSKRVSTLRLMISWDALQPHLYDPIPNSSAAANYQTYLNNLTRAINYATNTDGLEVIIEPWQANSSGGAGGGRWRGCVIGATASCSSSSLSPVPVPIDAFADFWGKMATLYKNNPRVSYGLINEPNNQSTMTWFKAAQAAITAIRATGSTQRIFVPGNGWAAATSWNDTWPDSDSNKVSNAYAWLNANGTGKPLSDPLNNIFVEVHTYLDSDGSGNSSTIASKTQARQNLAPTVNWAAANGLKVWLAEIGIDATATQSGFRSADAWQDFINYFNANSNTLIGYTWWAGSEPAWWRDVKAPHFSVSPTSSSTYTGDTANMQMIQNDF